MRYLPARVTSFAVITFLLLSACGGDTAIGARLAQPTITTAPTPPATATATPPAPTPTPTRTGPPPKKGSLAWYIDQLPHFDPAPAPTKVRQLPAKGPAVQINQVPVNGQRVAFITIDDGWLKDRDIVTLLRAAGVPFTMFLTSDAIKSDPTFFGKLQEIGGVIEVHTISHPKLSQLSYERQRKEICTNRATLARLYGRAPTIMRAPYGLSNADTLRAAASCGIGANVFWNEYAIDGSISWQRPGGIHPGDMVLMHFDKYLKANLLTTLRAFHRDRITPALLEDYLVATDSSAP